MENKVKKLLDELSETGNYELQMDLIIKIVKIYKEAKKIIPNDVLFILFIDTLEIVKVNAIGVELNEEAISKLEDE